MPTSHAKLPETPPVPHAPLPATCCSGRRVGETGRPGGAGAAPGKAAVALALALLALPPVAPALAQSPAQDTTRGGSGDGPGATATPATRGDAGDDPGPDLPVRLTLDALISRTRDDPRAAIARWRTEAARGQADEAAGARWPRLSITSFVAPSPEIRCVDPACTRTTPADVSLALSGVFGGVRVSAVQPIFTFGKLDAIGEAARHAVRATQLLEGAVAGDLAYEAARAYYGLKLARDLVWMLEDGLAELDKYLAGAEERLAEGDPDVTVQDKLRVETLRAEVAARVTEARQAEAIALAAVRALAGDPLADIDDAELAMVERTLADTAEPYVAQAQAARPEVQAAREGARAADANARFERARYLPDVVVAGAVEVARAQGVDDPPTAFADDPFNTTTAAIGLALRWELDVMSQRGRVRQADAQARQAAALSRAAGRAAEFEVQRAFAEAAHARERARAAQAGEKSARGWVAAVLQAQAVGTVEAKDLADAYIAYFTLRSRARTAVYEWNLAVVGLRRALGEFSPTR